MNNLRIGFMSAALIAGLASANAQTVAADSVMQHVNGKRRRRIWRGSSESQLL